MTEDTKLQELVTELDRLVPQDHALVRVQHGGKIMGQSVVANKQGLMRLGIELLKAAFVIKDKNGKNSDDWYFQPIDYLRAHPFNSISAIYRDEEITREELPPREKPTRRDRLLAALARLFTIFLAMMLGLGIFTFIKWLLSLFR